MIDDVAEQDDADRVVTWLSRGASPNYEIDCFGNSVMHAVAANPLAEAERMMTLLVNAGGCLDHENDLGQTVVDVAVVHGHVAILRLLLCKHDNKWPRSECVAKLTNGMMRCGVGA